MRSLLAPLLLFACSGNAATLPEFPPNAIWSRDISNSTVYPNHPNSAAMITATGGWGNGNVFQIDQSMHVMHVSAANEASVPMLTVAAERAELKSSSSGKPAVFPAHSVPLLGNQASQSDEEGSESELAPGDSFTQSWSGFVG